eukprot:350457-Chlamydomonas_euryale.AAC.4
MSHSLLCPPTPDDNAVHPLSSCCLPSSTSHLHPHRALSSTTPSTACSSLHMIFDAPCPSTPPSATPLPAPPRAVPCTCSSAPFPIQTPPHPHPPHPHPTISACLCSSTHAGNGSLTPAELYGGVD